MVNSMDKKQLFVEACKAGRWKWRVWRISIFSVTKLPEDHKPVDYDIDYTDNGIYYYLEGDWHPLNGVDKDAPLYRANEITTFDEGVIPNHGGGPLETTYGKMLYNWMILVYPFGDKIPFTDNLLPKKIVKVFGKKTVDEPEDGNYESGKFYPSEVSKFVEACFELTPLAPYIAPTGSVKSLTTHPDMVKVRNALLKKYEDTLDDPATVTMIQNELVELDKEWIKGDDAEDFYISNKAYTVKRKKLFAMHGIEASFREDGGYDLVTKSLSEGEPMDNLVAKFNSIREGSYDRGKDTALGGEKVTFLQRVFQNTKVVDGDCGTKMTYAVLLNDANYQKYKSMNIQVGEKPVQLNDDTFEKYKDKVVQLRRPLLCKQSHIDYCSACAGFEYGLVPTKAASDIASIGSQIMLAFMSSMHGNELAVHHYDHTKHLK